MWWNIMVDIIEMIFFFKTDQTDGHKKQLAWSQTHDQVLNS